jgi:hypothetical protein
MQGMVGELGGFRVTPQSPGGEVGYHTSAQGLRLYGLKGVGGVLVIRGGRV